MQREFQPAAYMLANKRNGTIYVGVTSDLVRRAWEHREGVADGFTKRYACKLLVWYELHSTMEHAILREKQIKGGSRRKKIDLIESANPQWCDLFADICAKPPLDCFASLAMTKRRSPSLRGAERRSNPGAALTGLPSVARRPEVALADRAAGHFQHPVGSRHSAGGRGIDAAETRC